MIIDAFELTKYRCWLPILVCLLVLLKLEDVYTTYHVIQLLDPREFDKVDINALVEKWMLCGLWIMGT